MKLRIRTPKRYMVAIFLNGQRLISLNQFEKKIGWWKLLFKLFNKKKDVLKVELLTNKSKLFTLELEF